MENTVEYATVQTTTGKVRGQKRIAVYGDQFYSFDGMPYAKTPIGNLRFKAPVPIEKWSGVKNCTEIANKSVQWNRYIQEIEGSEDCLYINIYAKALTSPHKLPVMVYVHGGGFNTGSASRMAWGPDYFMMKDMILITIGYRLGLLGFAHFKNKSLEIPGNSGLKDIVLALQWIRDNCDNFNGDSGNITLFGHSSGSDAAYLIMLSPEAEGLFHKVILMAGRCVDIPDLPNLQFRLAKHLGYQGCQDNEKDLCEFLTEIDCKKLVGFDIWTVEEKFKYLNIPFVPTIETFVDENSIVTDEPIRMQRQTWSKGIPVMMGCTSKEGLCDYKILTTDENIYRKYRENNELLLPLKLQHLKDKENLLNKLAQQMKSLHFGDKEMTPDNYEAAIEHRSYFIYHNQHRILQSRLKYSTAANYIYRFDFDSPFFNLYRLKLCGPNVRGVGHVDELSYLFFLPTSYKLDAETPEFKCIETMIESFYSFARYSHPSNTKVNWEPVQKSGIPQCLNISYEKTEMIEQPEYEKCCVRDDIYRKAGLLPY